MTGKASPLYSNQMEHSSPHEAPTNGAATTSAVAAPSNLLSDGGWNIPQIIEDLHALRTQVASLQIHMQEHCAKIAELENAKARFEGALKQFSKMIFDGPMSKIILASMPKEAQQKIKAFIDGNN